ncbi:hypothetical protein L7F22_012662 [Adiantum nelumboides]|nr:hypothetical protein [Adiantum nelumboides]
MERLDPLSSRFTSHSCAFILAALLLLLVLSTPPAAAAASHHDAGISATSPFEGMYAWGDSLTDTGNALLYQLSLNIDGPLGGHLPYGQTFFHYPTGRISDGRIVVDFLETFSKALVYFGQIGGNDYTSALLYGFSIKDIITEFVPAVVKGIQNALEFLIEKGAKYLVIEGAYPIGCTPRYTRLLYTNATTNQYGCVEDLQRLNAAHDELLKQVVHNLTGKYNQHVHFIFFDQLKAYKQILKHPSLYGITNTIDPCFHTLYTASLKTVVACSNPSTYLSWDGLHFSEAANMAFFNLFFTKGFVTPYPNFLTSKSFSGAGRGGFDRVPGGLDGSLAAPPIDGPVPGILVIIIIIIRSFVMT